MLQNAKLYTGTKDTATRERSNTDIIVHKGTITAIGTDLEVPSGATVIDAAGRVVTPGIVDMYAPAMLVAHSLRSYDLSPPPLGATTGIATVACMAGQRCGLVRMATR